jgi:flagellar hook-associated protein 3 FlgL
MGMRVVYNPYTTLLQGIEQDRETLNTAMSQVSTGLKFDSIGADPTAVAGVIENNFEAANLDQYTQSVSSLQGQFQAAGTALDSVTQVLTTTIGLGVQGANGTLTQNQRDALATQVTQLQQQVLGYANTQYRGTYVFAGTATTTQPYVQSSGSPPGIQYVGNARTNTVEIGGTQSVQQNVPGSTIFNASNADVFKGFSDLTTALQNGDTSGITSATSELQAAFSNVGLQRAFYSSTLQSLNTASYTLSQQQTNLTAQQDNLLAADPAQAITNMTEAQVALDAAMAAAGRVDQNSLLNYLK